MKLFLVSPLVVSVSLSLLPTEQGQLISADGENNGELVFGQADTSKFDASTTQTLEVTSPQGFWQVAMSAVTVNDADTSTNRQAILDTGTSLMVAPEPEYVFAPLVSPIHLSPRR